MEFQTGLGYSPNSGPPQGGWSNTPGPGFFGQSMESILPKGVNFSRFGSRRFGCGSEGCTCKGGCECDCKDNCKCKEECKKQCEAEKAKPKTDSSFGSRRFGSRRFGSRRFGCGCGGKPGSSFGSRRFGCGCGGKIGSSFGSRSFGSRSFGSRSFGSRSFGSRSFGSVYPLMNQESAWSPRFSVGSGNTPGGSGGVFLQGLPDFQSYWGFGKKKSSKKRSKKYNKHSKKCKKRSKKYKKRSKKSRKKSY